MQLIHIASLTYMLIVLFDKYFKLFVCTLQRLLGCHSTSDLNLGYDRSQKVTHDLIKQFYNGLILHQQFIEYLTNHENIKHTLKTNLTNIAGELDHNIARLYHLVNFLYV